MTRAQIVERIAREFSAQSLPAQLGEVESADQMIDGQDPLLAFVAWCREQAVEAIRASEIADLPMRLRIPRKYQAAGYVETLVRDFLFEKAAPILDDRAQEAERPSEPCPYCGGVGPQRCSCDDGDDERGA